MERYPNVTEFGLPLRDAASDDLTKVNSSAEKAGATAAPACEASAPRAAPLRPEPRDEALNVLTFLGQRYSVGPKYLTVPAPSAEELAQAVAVALRAPDHQQLRPFRFVRVGAAQRERLGDLFALDAARRGHGAAQVERARARAQNGPMLLAVVARVRANVEDIPDHEQWACVGAGIMNLLNALHLMGYGAKLLSGASVRDPDIQAAFCRTGETLVAWVLAGTPTRMAHPKHAEDLQAALSDWV